MLEPKDIFGTMFSRAGIAINGPNPWDIHINDEQFYTRLLRDNSLGLDEAYMDGLWRCRQIGESIYRILKAKLDKETKNSIKFLLNPLAQELGLEEDTLTDLKRKSIICSVLEILNI
ncbi:MAG TPA: hypothetical protein VJZ49_12270 [Syntrophales bacterium]|nr:hypothetical protein [Syntrophales bacterium]